MYEYRNHLGQVIAEEAVLRLLNSELIVYRRKQTGPDRWGAWELVTLHSTSPSYDVLSLLATIVRVGT